MLKIVREIMKEVADPWIITVAINSFALKMFLVMPQLVFDIGQLGIELIIFVFLGPVQIGIYA